MAFNEDFSGFFNVQEFAEPVQLHEQSVTVNAVFMTPDDLAELAKGGRAASALPVHITNPALLLATEDVAGNNLKKGDLLTVLQAKYRVAVPPLNDGTGVTTVYLVEDTEQGNSARRNPESWRR